MKSILNGAFSTLALTALLAVGTVVGARYVPSTCTGQHQTNERDRSSSQATADQ